MRPTALEVGLRRDIALTDQEREHLRSLQDDAQNFPAKKNVIKAGGRGQSAYIVKAGWLIEFKILKDGRRQILNFQLPGEIIGVDGLAYTRAVHSSMSLTAVELAPITLSQFMETLHLFPRIAAILFIRTLRQKAILREWEVSLGRRTAYEKLCHLLLELHVRLRSRDLARDGTFDLPVTQEELADSLGLTPPYVNRILRRLRKEGFLEFQGRTLIIKDTEELRQKAHFDPSYLEDTVDVPELSAERSAETPFA